MDLMDYVVSGTGVIVLISAIVVGVVGSMWLTDLQNTASTLGWIAGIVGFPALWLVVGLIVYAVGKDLFRFFQSLKKSGDSQ